MEKITRSQFIQKYGFDPHDPASFTQKAPTTGAIGGSTDTAPKQTLTPEEVTAAMSSQPPQTLSADEVAKISGGASDSGYQPGKFMQSMENFRPDYSGGFLSDVGEGLGDVSVGVVKGLVRTVPELIQTLTPDAMWGENSLLNSESERAKAFRSATTGKTGLQKLGATGVDLASMFVPFGAAGKAASLSSRGARGASTLSKMVTGGMDLATEAPSLLQRGGKILNKIAPSVGDSVVSGAIAGRGESPVSDVLLGTLSPVAGKALSVMSDALGSQGAKSAFAGVKDYVVGGNKYTQQILDSAMKHIDDMGPDALKESIPQIETNRTAFRDILKPRIAKMFGSGSRGLDKLNEASDIFTLGYFDKLDVVDGLVDYTKAQDALRADKDVIGGIISKASNTIRTKAIPAKTALKSLNGKMQSTGINIYDEGYRDAKKMVYDFVANSTDGGKKEFTVQMLDGLRSSLTKKIQSLQPTQSEMKKLYSEIYSWTNDMVYNVAKNSGEKDVADLIKEANSSYSKLKNVDAIVEAMSKTRLNPFGLSQGQKIAISYGAGGLGGAVSGPFGVPAGMIVAGPLQKIISGALTKRAISKVKSNVYTKAASLKRFGEQEAITNKLSEIINKQAKK